MVQNQTAKQEQTCKRYLALRTIRSLADFPREHSTARFEVTDQNGNTRAIIVSKRKRQMLETLMIGPVYGPSVVRPSDTVMRLREDCGLNIETVRHEGNPLTHAGQYGSYHFLDKVRRTDPPEIIPGGVTAPKQEGA